MGNLRRGRDHPDRPDHPDTAGGGRRGLIFAAMRLRVALPAAFVTGGVMALGQAPWGFWPLTLIGFVVLAAFLETARNTKHAALTGWAAGTGYFAVSLNWIIEPFLVDIARHGWMAPFAILFLAAGLALFWMLAFGLARRAGGAGLAALALVLMLPAAELLRAYIFTGFPWAMPAYVWLDLPPMQLVAWIGPHGLNVLTLLMTAGVWGLTRISRPGAVVLAIAAWGLALSGNSLSPDQLVSEKAPVLLRLIQPNAPQHQKWDPEFMPVFFERSLAYTAAPDVGRRPDLIIWPETSVPAILTDSDYARGRIRDAAGGVPVVAGMHNESAAGYHNAMVLIDADGVVTQTYNKVHLVPFGEYMPLGGLMARFGIYGLAANQGFGFAPGAQRSLLDLGDIGRVLPLICYEAVFPQDLNAAPDGADWILQITNDAWFGTRSGPWQHLAQAQFRAVEQGKPLVRVANTGVTAVIDANGRVVAALPFGEAGFLDTSLPTGKTDTYYRRHGDIPVLIFLMLAGFGLILRRARRDTRH